MEFMPGGDLRSYLHRSRKTLELINSTKAEPHVISQATILQFALDIANGMSHLAARQVSTDLQRNYKGIITPRLKKRFHRYCPSSQM